MRKVSDGADDVDLIEISNFGALFLQQFSRLEGVVVSYFLVPFRDVECFADHLTGGSVLGSVAGKHEVGGCGAHDVFHGFAPDDFEGCLVLHDVGGQLVLFDELRVWCRYWLAEVVQIVFLQVFQSGLHGGRDSQRVVGVDAVVLEVLWESAEEELVEHTSVVDAEIAFSLTVAPVGQGAWVVVVRVESVATDQRNGVRQNSAGDGVRRAETRARSHGLLCVLDDDTWVDLNLVGVIVEVLELLLHIFV